ncbi:hypothetical protein [Xanthomonas graminis]|uniref:Secreted protein n=1 Tax=Xanthomonas graminis pv. phlei TaxID=487906 RepID=A0A0K3A3T2_9XANT|nr:hypothetical protein [Xanthomonas translucens]UKE65592.1 hypothetical protein KM547_18395 [Xanthomonas translucens pv. phlei]UKE73104.1 hypothetical protein KFS85_19145 [Xanthomonas translucens pv. phleipratensis]CTP92791.1 hypothetical protein XTPLMG730_3616 [Xanthomonas translucens pv. phlei]
MKYLVLALACALAAPVALAQSGYVEIERRLSAEQLREVGLTPAQLATLNRLLRDAETRQAAQAPARPAATPAVAGAAVGDPQAEQGMLIGLDDGPISARVQGEVAGWAPGTVFVLDNGQQWKVLKGSMTLRSALASPAIKVVPGIAGRWFLQVDEDLPKARVYRIR